MYLKSTATSTKTLRQKNHDLEDLVDHYKKEMRRFKSRYANTRALPKVQGDPDDLEGVISLLLPKVTERFPELKGLIGTQDISTIIDTAKKHPEIAKKIISKFVSTGKKDEEITKDDNDTISV